MWKLIFILWNMKVYIEMNKINCILYSNEIIKWFRILYYVYFNFKNSIK